ncbi:IclR family transcriptional regulator [Ureibacillus sp. FSL K6-8385]|uniref:Glycerol operon regulatory protein n=1 Tax=Ureibacillus terrenus TaxID=118246 RepID=A0A540V1Q7_9BACL|nr:IclR family transcriptional regulator [Ureibacillus terrenus]MED3662025.1 IclR family transcriptional regulator [Ureibacillus terrenus]MED3764696.1 IclR family transcriptional regulator [Ureibacillus terrenus]TQE90651.1 IclR family transcriptional regulator [Ureibacillus terrenus]
MKHALDEKYFVQSVKNAMRILKLFNKRRQELSVTEISQFIGLPKSTVHRLLKELVREGFLLQNPGNAKYQLGYSILGLGGIVKFHIEEFGDARPLLRQFVKEFNLPVHICVLEQHKVTYLMRETGTDSMNLITKTGRQNDIHCTAEGLVILAYKNQQIIDYVLSKPLKPYTPYTITDAETLRKELLKIRSRGFAILKDAYAEGYSSYAAPIRDYTGEIFASLAVISKNDRIPSLMEENLITAVQKTAKQISEIFGYYD